jgi:hypothetical protein
MSLTTWLRGLFHPSPEKRAAQQLSRSERLRAQNEVRAAKAEAEAVRHQFHPPTPPGGFGH